jgi:hypothetical protein
MDEHAHDPSLWEGFVNLWQEPSHLLYEVSVDVVVNTVYLLILTPLWLWILRRHDKRKHARRVTKQVIDTTITVVHDHDSTPVRPTNQEGTS